MGRADAFLEEEDEAPDDGDCSENPYECHCERCQAWLIDIEADRKFDERKMGREHVTEAGFPGPGSFK